MHHTTNFRKFRKCGGWSDMDEFLFLVVIIGIGVSFYASKHESMLVRTAICGSFSTVFFIVILIVMIFITWSPPGYHVMNAFLISVLFFTAISSALSTIIYEWKPWRERSQFFRTACFMSGCWAALSWLWWFILGWRNMHSDNAFALMVLPVFFIWIACYIYKKYIVFPAEPKQNANVDSKSNRPVH